MDAEVRCTLDVAENSLDKLHVGVARLMHEQANLLDSVGYVWACEGEILQSAGKTSVVRGVGQRATNTSRKFRGCVDWCWNWFTV